jgi:hypothetical protein
MQIDKYTGPQSQGDGGSTGSIRTGRTNEQIVCDSHGRYYEPASRGRVFFASNVAAQAVSVALTTTYTGLCISNPLGSGFNLALIGCQYALTVAPAGIASLHLLAGYSTTTNVTHGTPLASPGIQGGLIGPGLGVGSVARADSAATTVNPTYLMGVGSGFTAGALYGTTPSWIDLAGQIVVPPGGWVAWGALTAVTGFGSFSWEEIPV